MNLQELIKWASEYDTMKVPQEKNKRNNANVYLGMIQDKGNRVLQNNAQNTDYMSNLDEYLGQLKKIGVTHQAEVTTPTAPAGEPEKPKTQSPLIP